jgi:hypothetical protein
VRRVPRQGLGHFQQLWKETKLTSYFLIDAMELCFNE